MELSERKKRILRAVIDDYIQTAAPVGSKALADHHDLRVSSATIRSEMSELEELGFLAQPHTSAGRIPSQTAYRVYVDHLMQLSALPKMDAKHLKSYFQNQHQRLVSTEEILSAAARALSETTSYVSVVMAPKLVGIAIRHIQLVYVSGRSALLVLVTDAGILKDTIVQLPFDIDPDMMDRASHILCRMLVGRTLHDLRQDNSRLISREILREMEILSRVSDVVGRQLQETEEEQEMVVEGTAGVLAHPEYSDVDKARSFLEFINRRDNIGRLLRGSEDMALTIRIGREHREEPVNDCSTITATYSVNGKKVGQLGIIGPVRMQYGKVVAVLEYMKKALQELLEEQLE